MTTADGDQDGVMLGLEDWDPRSPNADRCVRTGGVLCAFCHFPPPHYAHLFLPGRLPSPFMPVLDTAALVWGIWRAHERGRWQTPHPRFHL